MTCLTDEFDYNYITLSMSESLTDDSDYTIFNKIKQNKMKVCNYKNLTD